MRTKITVKDMEACFLPNNRKTRRSKTKGNNYKRTKKNEIIQYWR